jgi:hypothetical protein
LKARERVLIQEALDIHAATRRHFCSLPHPRTV